MTRHSRPLAIIAVLAIVLAAGLLPAASASAQPAPLYPYVAQQNQSYAVQVAPNTYVIQRPAETRNYPYVRCVNCSNRAKHRAAAPAPGRFDRPHKPVDHALVEELRKRSKHKAKDKDDDKEQDADTTTTKIVRDPPVVIEHKRYVDDPPRVIERKIIVDEPARAKCKRGIIEHCANGSRASSEDGKKRIIEADAEVTVLGPDRMSIRLFRKGQGPRAKASDDE